MVRGFIVCVGLVCVGLAVLCLQTGRPWIADAHADSGSSPPSVALVGFDALGMDLERVQRLETLFLKELERLTQTPVPTRRAIAKLKRRLQRCDGGNACLAAIGSALKVDLVVAGNVAELGDSFVLNIKAVASASGEELRRIESEPLRGQPDELIEAIRVAAYRLLSPEELTGSVSVLVDREGAIIELDSVVIGKTPLAAPISGLAIGSHSLRVSAGDFGEFKSEVVVRFQKTSRVVVNLVDLRVQETAATSAPGEAAMVVRDSPKKWYQKTWFLVSAGLGAAAVGIVVGTQLSDDPVINCSKDPSRCIQ